MNSYTVTLTVNFDADTPEDAAQEFGEWINSVEPKSVTVTNDDNNTATEHYIR